MEKAGRHNCCVVIFGASGDLTKRKLIPAIFELYTQKLLPEGFAVLGVARTPMTDEAFREAQKQALQEFSKPAAKDPAAAAAFIKCLHYVHIDTAAAADYAKIETRLKEIDSEHNTSGNYLYYFSTPPSLAAPIVEGLGKNNMQNGPAGTWRRCIVEKPFGVNLRTASELNQMLLKVFKEDQVYRIDHYLGKETVQNLLVFRFSNGIFEPLWNRNYVDYVEITAAESVGVEGRGGYYEQSGAIRDMIQNHMLQLVGMVAMESPPSFDARAVRNETIKVFQSLRAIHPHDVHKCTVRGQYTESTVRGEKMPGYRQEQGVNPHSRTETFAAIKFFIENWRWGGVPFFLRSGKRLPTRVTEIVIHFKPTPHRLFSYNYDGSSMPNQLIIRIQPDEGIVLRFGMKLPGAGFQIKNVSMEFHYSDLSNVRLPDAYERLILDCMLGDPTLFTRGDAVEACWSFIDPVLEGWNTNPESRIFGYPAGSWGPREMNLLFETPGREWRQPAKNLSEEGEYCEL